MFKGMRRAFCIAAVMVFASAAVYGQETVTLAIKGEQGRILQYRTDVGGTLSFVLDGLPIPNSKITGENLAADMSVNAYFDTLETGEDFISYSARMMMGKITLGGLLQLPDLTGGVGAPELVLTINPQGSIENIEVKNFNLPGADMLKGGMPGMGDMGMDLSSMDAIMPILVGLLPPIFPEDPVAVGDKWAQKPGEDDMPLPIFPVVEFRYLLEAIDGNVAKIKFQSKGKYDAGFIKNFLSMIPEIPMGDDQMTIDDVDLLMTWEIAGTMDFAIEEGLIQKVAASGNVKIDGGGALTFTHPDGNSEPWEPRLSGNLDMEFGLEYIGDVARADFEALFPPPAPEEESTDDEDSSGAGDEI